MSEKSRVFGNNMRVYLKKKKMEPEQFAKRLGYSAQEVNRMMDARMFLTAEEKEQIAAELGVTVEALYEMQADRIYENAGCYECRGEFSEVSNKKIIFDLFDTYCDIQEVLMEEGLKEVTAESST